MVEENSHIDETIQYLLYIHIELTKFIKKKKSVTSNEYVSE